MKTSLMLYTIFFDNNNYHFTYNTIVFRMELNPPAKETETRKVIANSNCKKTVWTVSQEQQVLSSKCRLELSQICSQPIQ